MLKFRFDSQAVSPHVIVGPRLDLLIAKDPQGFQAVLNEFKAIDVGLSLGAGGEVPTSFLSSVLLEFRYSPTFNTSFSNAHSRRCGINRLSCCSESDSDSNGFLQSALSVLLINSYFLLL
jgi:hypothetical protein